MTNSLCVNCNNVSFCTWKSDATIMCNEYHVMETKHPPPIFKQPISYVLKELKSIAICSNCELEKNCQLKSRNVHMMYCEEYK